MSFLEIIDAKIDKIKSLIKGLEDKAPKPDLGDILGVMGREELIRAKNSYEKFALQQREFLERKALETDPKPLPLEEWLKTKTWRSDHEKDLLVKVYGFHNKKQETEIIPLPLKAVKRIIINGKPYVEFDKPEGKAKVIEDIGKNL